MEPTELQVAQAKLEEFLQRNPHMRAYQEEIDRRLNAAKPEERMEILGIMMAEATQKLSSKLNELVETLRQV